MERLFQLLMGAPATPPREEASQYPLFGNPYITQKTIDFLGYCVDFLLAHGASSRKGGLYLDDHPFQGRLRLALHLLDPANPRHVLPSARSSASADPFCCVPWYTSKFHLLRQGITEQGIFRVPGEGELVKKLKEAFNKGT